MSMSTSIIYGYGFEVHADEKTIADFVKTHGATIAKRGITEEIELLTNCKLGNYEGIKEEHFDINCDTSGNEGIYAIISNVMSTETGIDFQYEIGDSDCDSTDTILLVETMPWCLSEKEKSLTQEELDAIVRKYVDELGIITTIGYVKVEYYG